MLSLVQTAAADTVLAVSVQGPLGIARDVAILVGTLAITIASIGLVALAAQLRRTVAELRRAAHQNLGPVSDRARAVSDNVEFITRALRTDVERLNASVKALTDRLHQASDRMEERIEEFNALMEVVQDEAEEIFLDTASTMRGVRAGARSVGSPRAAGALGGRSVGEQEGEAGSDPTEHIVPGAAER